MRVKSPPRPRAESRTAQPYHVFAETQRAKRSVAYMSDKSCKLLPEHLVDKRRELVRTAPDIAADDIALRHFGAAVDGLQGPGKRPNHGLRLERPEPALAAPPLAWPSIDQSAIPDSTAPGREAFPATASGLCFSGQ